MTLKALKAKLWWEAYNVPGFDEQYYLQQKLTSLHQSPEYDYITTTAQLKELMGYYRPPDHYKGFGSGENINVNAYFNKVEYLQSKLLALRENPATADEWKDKSIGQVEAAMTWQGVTPVEYYFRYGFAETRADGTLINPSNAFDANAYFAAKLLQLQKTYPGQYDNHTVQDVVNIFRAEGLDPVTHYINYGAQEAQQSGIAFVQTVPTSQRVSEDLHRNLHNNLVPDNPVPPTLPPGRAHAQAVPQPGDMGGRDPGNFLPPSPMPVPTPPLPDLDIPGGNAPSGPAQPFPQGEHIILSTANAAVTPLSSLDAEGKYTGHNRNDTVEIKDAAAYVAQIHMGTCSDRITWQGNTENDTLIFSAGTESVPQEYLRDGFVHLKTTGVETLVFGEGAQKVYFDDQAQYPNLFLRKIAFDNEGDALFTMSDSGGRTLGFDIIRNNGENQGSIIVGNELGGTNDGILHLDYTLWDTKGTLKEIVFKNSRSVDFSLLAKDLGKVASIRDEHEDRMYAGRIALKGSLTSENGVIFLGDKHVQGFDYLDLYTADFDQSARTLYIESTYNIVFMSAYQWKSLTRIEGSAGNSKVFSLRGSETANESAIVSTLLQNEGCVGFETLDLQSMSDLSALNGLDATKANFKTIQLDLSTFNSLGSKTLLGREDQTLSGSITESDEMLDALGRAKGFSTLEVSKYDYAKPKPLTLAEGTSFTHVIANNWWALLHVVDKSGLENTLTLDRSGSTVRTFGIEHIIFNPEGGIQTDSFADTALKSIKVDRLTLYGEATVETEAAFSTGIVADLKELVLHLLDTNTMGGSKKFALDMRENADANVSISLEQLSQIKLSNCNGVVSLSSYSERVDLSHFAQCDMKKSNGQNADFNITADDIDMGGYIGSFLTLSFSPSPSNTASVIGGDSGNHISGYDGFTYKGGAGADTLVITAHSSLSERTLMDGGAGDDILTMIFNPYCAIGEAGSTVVMTGGTGTDTFKLDKYTMDCGQTRPGETNMPNTILQITDFKHNGEKDTLDLRTVSYGEISYTAKDFIGAVNIAGATTLQEAVNAATTTITAGKIGVFNYDGSAYVYGNNANAAMDKGDLLIQLQGVDATTLTTEDIILNS